MTVPERDTPRPRQKHAWLAVLLANLPLLFVASCEPITFPELRSPIQIRPSMAFVSLLTLLPLMLGWGWGYAYLKRPLLFSMVWWIGFVSMGFLVAFTFNSCLSYLLRDWPGGLDQQATLRVAARCAVELDRAYLIILVGVVAMSLHVVWLLRRSRSQA